MVKNTFTPDQKIQIVLESIKTSTSAAELCRRHNLHPHTLAKWKERFMDGGRDKLRHSGRGDPAGALKRERDSPKGIIGELTIANDILKKTLEGSKG